MQKHQHKIASVVDDSMINRWVYGGKSGKEQKLLKLQTIKQPSSTTQNNSTAIQEKSKTKHSGNILDQSD